MPFVADHRYVTDASIAVDDLSLLSSPSAGFTGADEGRAVVVADAGPAGVGCNLPHASVIVQVLDASTVRLARPAIVPVPGVRTDWGTDNTSALQAAADSGEAVMPAGRFLAAGTVNVAGALAMRGAGRGTTTIVHPSWGDLVYATSPSGSTLTFEDFTVQGPVGVKPHQQVTYGAVRYLRDLTYASVMSMRRVDVVGTFNNAVTRSGGGRFELEDCWLEGTDGCAGAFESLAAADSMFVTARGCTFTAPNGDNSPQGTVGFYIHPHVAYGITDCRFVSLGRYGVYENGSPATKRRPSLISGCTFIDAELVRTESRGRTLIVGCTARGSLSRLGSSLYGHETRFDGCSFENCAPLYVNRSASVTGCTFVNTQVGISSDPAATSLHVSGCRWRIDNTFPSNCLEVVGSAPTKLYVEGCVFEDTTTPATPTPVGKVAYLPNSAGEATFRGCSFVGVRDPGAAGIIYTRGARLRLEGCEFDNRAQGSARAISARNVGCVEGSGNAFLGAAQFAVWDGTNQQRLVRRSGANPTPVASASSIDTNVAAWLNYDTHTVTGSAVIATLANPWVAVGPVRLIVADGAAWSLTDAGNIAPLATTPRAPRTVVTLLWEPSVGKWLEV